MAGSERISRSTVMWHNLKDMVDVPEETTREAMYMTLRQLVCQHTGVSSSSYFPHFVPNVLLTLMKTGHDDGIALLACTLLGCYCTSSYGAMERVVRQGGLQLLLRLLKTEVVPSKDDIKMKTILYNQLSTMLVYCSYGADYCREEMLLTGVTAAMMRILDQNNLFCFGFPVGGATLSDLTVNRVLVGQCLVMDAHVRCQAYSSQFRGYRGPDKAFVLDLYDTSQQGVDVHIVDKVVESNPEMWKDEGNMCETETDGVSAEWTDVRVTHVFNDAFFWARLGIDAEERMAKVEKMMVENCGEPLVGDLDLQATVCVKDDNIAGGLYRARIVNLFTSSVDVFAIDYGFVKNVPFTQICSLDATGSKEHPALANLCKLKGIHGMVVQPHIVNSALKVLCNLSYGPPHAMILKYYQTSDVSVRLLHLLRCPDTELQTLTLKVYINLARLYQLRATLARGPVMSICVDLLGRHTSHLDLKSSQDLIETCLSLIAGLLYESQEHSDIFQSLNGLQQVTVLTAQQVPQTIRTAAFTILHQLQGKPVPLVQPSQVMPSGTVSPSQSASLSQSNKCTRLPATTVDNSAVSRTGSDNTVSRNVSDINSDLYAARNEVDLLSTAGVIFINDILQHDSTVLVSSPVSRFHQASSLIRRFRKGSQTSWFSDEHRELCIEMQHSHIRDMSHIICGFLNTRKGGSLFYGIDAATGKVRGMIMENADRDAFRLCIDRLAREFEPTPLSRCVRVIFHDVVSDGDVIDNLYIPEIRVVRSLHYHKAYGILDVDQAEKRCFERHGNVTRLMDAWEVACWLDGVDVIQAEEIVTLKEQLQILKDAVNAVS